jgi:RecB family exonuclease
MGRKSKEYLNKLKKKYGVDTLWSWSKYNSYKTDPYGWMLKYIKHEKETKTSIYGISGGNVHDIVEKFYKKEITYEQMIEEYESKLFEMNMAELKYNRKDEKANEAIADKYESCIRLFFRNHIPIETKVITEQFVTIKVGKNIFQGYIDFVHKDDEGNYIITDWKTSTLYVGQKVKKECGQLVLYAESLIQKGIPLENIKIRWNFLKYCNIEYQLKGVDKVTKLHKTKETKELRDRWVSKISNNLKMWLGEFEYDELTIEDMVQTAISNNNLDNIPQEIQEKYTVSDCYVYIPLTQDIIDELKQNIVNTINEIKEKEKDYNIYIEQGEDDKAEELFWTEIDDKNQFYFANLCGYSAKQHKPYKEYLDTLNLFVQQDKQDGNTDINDDWLKDL